MTGPNSHRAVIRLDITAENTVAPTEVSKNNTVCLLLACVTGVNNNINSIKVII